MWQKEKRVVITFYTTTAAMQMERVCKELGQKGRIIPVPREISAGCGLAWSAPEEERENLVSVMEAHHITAQQITVLEL